MMATLASAAEYMRGRLEGTDRLFDGVSTDTRTLRNGELFVALKGPNFDGGDYVEQASEKGAAGAVVGDRVDCDIAQITVGDTKHALGQLGASWRREQSAVVIGITGSNGKTTLKELTASCLSRAAPTLATEGNFNNDIGLPLMLTRIESTHRYVVLEMGANHAGEIAYLSSLAEPDVVAITNAAAAHLEGFGSIDGVARAKGEILRGDIRPGVAILNADDEYFGLWKTWASDVDVLSFGIDGSADVCANGIVADGGGSAFELRMPGASIDVRLALPGRHNVRNACAAAAIATALGVLPEQVQSGLEAVKPVAGRLQPREGLGGAVLYDDSYNANPLSVEAAAQFLASLDGQGWFVLGDMKELGEDAVRLHAEVGRAVKRVGVDRLFATGELSRNATEAFGSNASWFESVDTLIDALRVSVTPDVNLLVKGSRSMRMERVVKALRSSGTEA
ncbi:MAG: UDP-N-acetylmuramoyl-tripeptide--D-alanyl-D-alanine ligase [Woeseiaceae bacterium]